MRHRQLKYSSDNVLVELIRQGNELAFSQVFDRYWESLLDAAMKVLKDRDAAQDSVQEVFTDFWRKRSTLRIHNLQAYLNQSVKYKVIDQIRKRKMTFSNLDHVDQFIATNNTEESFDYQALHELLDNSVRELPDQCERVFRMSRFQQMSNKEIASHLDLSVRTVENHIAHALKLLRLKLGSAAALLLLFLPVG